MKRILCWLGIHKFKESSLLRKVDVYYDSDSIPGGIRYEFSTTCLECGYVKVYKKELNS